MIFAKRRACQENALSVPEAPPPVECRAPGLTASTQAANYGLLQALADLRVRRFGIHPQRFEDPRYKVADADRGRKFGQFARAEVRAITDHGIGRGERIRTSDSCVPNAVLYQAELHPESGHLSKSIF